MLAIWIELMFDKHYFVPGFPDGWPSLRGLVTRPHNRNLGPAATWGERGRTREPSALAATCREY